MSHVTWCDVPKISQHNGISEEGHTYVASHMISATKSRHILYMLHRCHCFTLVYFWLKTVSRVICNMAFRCNCSLTSNSWYQGQIRNTKIFCQPDEAVAKVAILNTSIGRRFLFSFPIEKSTVLIRYVLIIFQDNNKR